MGASGLPKCNKMHAETPSTTTDPEMAGWTLYPGRQADHFTAA
jgi:hypothetical protein